MRLRIDSKLGLRTFELLQGDQGPSAQAYQGWKHLRPQAIDKGSNSEYEILNPSNMTEGPDMEIIIEVISIGVGAEHPSGPRFGVLVHAVLRDAGFDVNAVDRLARLHGRVLGATSEEVLAASDAIRAALSAPLLRRAQSSSGWQRETPVRFRAGSNRVAEGVIDLMFLEDGIWHIVDFKTSTELADHLTRYERQLRWYASAVGQILRQPLVCHLLTL